MLENILRDPALPIGVLLTLEVGDKELFHSRPVVGAPKPESKPSMHLLDGQQRLTALWRSLTENYSDMSFHVSIQQEHSENSDEEDNTDERHSQNADAPKVEAIRRWNKNGVRMPVWANSAKAILDRGFVPAKILCPGSIGEHVYKAWKDEIKESGESIPDEVIERVSVYHQRIAKYDIPFLSLDVKTGRETALDIFINMNTSATPLKDFDIVVAQLESAAGESLHDMVTKLIEKVPAAREYGKTEDIILSVAALLMQKPPIKKTYLDMEFGAAFSGIWERLKHGFKHGLEFLHSEAILNEKCLPSDVAVYLTCALWADVPENALDAGGNARSLIRKALWRACYTERYGKTSATRSFADYKALKNMISGDNSVRCELFDDTVYPLPSKEELIFAGWPTRKDRLPRAIQATGLRRGGYDLADGATITARNFDNREYHHLYPVNFLGRDRADEYVNRALTCALISWTTNRRVGAQPPADYIKERAEAANLGEEVVKQRLKSHRLPYAELVENDYKNFLEKRADLIFEDMHALCEGKIPA